MTETESNEDAPSKVHEKSQDLSSDVGLASPLLGGQLEFVAYYDRDAADDEADHDYDQDGEDLRGQEIHDARSATLTTEEEIEN